MIDWIDSFYLLPSHPELLGKDLERGSLGRGRPRPVAMLRLVGAGKGGTCSSIGWITRLHYECRSAKMYSKQTKSKPMPRGREVGGFWKKEKGKDLFLVFFFFSIRADAVENRTK